MEVKLIKLEFNRGKEWKVTSFKWVSVKYCCDKMKENGSIILTNRDIIGDDGEEYPVPQFCTNNTVKTLTDGYEWDCIENYPIQFCPHCGKKINIQVVKTKDVTKEYKELKKQRKELSEKYNTTDSIRKREELKERIATLNGQIESFYDLDEVIEMPDFLKG